jgi:hypothetical protein
MKRRSNAFIPVTLASEPKEKPPNHGPDWGDVLTRLINASLVLLIVVVLGNVLRWLGGVDSTKFTNLSGLFGALTTFAGTAIGAYFGISVSGAATRTAVNTATDTSQKLGAASQQLAMTQDELYSANHTISRAFDHLGSVSADAAGPEHYDELRTILGERQVMV